MRLRRIASSPPNNGLTVNPMIGTSRIFVNGSAALLELMLQYLIVYKTRITMDVLFHVIYLLIYIHLKQLMHRIILFHVKQS